MKIKIENIVRKETVRMIQQIDIDRIIVDVAENGQRHPIVVVPIPRKGWCWFLYTQMYLLIDGFMRVKAMEALGEKYIEADVKYVSI